jgi:hypothetical protein
MKKLALLSLVAPAAFAAEEATVATLLVLVTVSMFSVFLSLSWFLLLLSVSSVSGAASAIGRNPSAASDIKSATLLPMVFAEGLGIVAVVLAFVVAFVK